MTNNLKMCLFNMELQIGTQVCIHNVYEGYSHVATPCIGTVTCEDPLEVELEDGERIPVDELYITEITDLEIPPVLIQPSDFQDIFDQLDDYKKIEYLMKALKYACDYIEVVEPLELLAQKMGYTFD